MKKLVFVIIVCTVAIAVNSTDSKAKILAKKDAIKRTLAKPVRIIEKNVEQMCGLAK